MADKFLIAPYDKDSGYRTNYKEWLIPDQSYSTLENAYVWRGRVRKRYGSFWLGPTQDLTRLKINIGNTGASDMFTFNVITGFVFNTAGTPLNAALAAVPAVGQMFSIGQNFYTVALSTATTNMLLVNGNATVATFNLTTGAVTINGSLAPANTIVYYYPALPVMGLLSLDTTGTNVQPTLAFDTQYSYMYFSTGWQLIANQHEANSARWTGADYQFFYGTTWVGADAAAKIFFVTNFNQAEPNYLRYLDNTNTWWQYRPITLMQTVGGVTTINYMDSCRLFAVFHNHLMAFNTWETTTVTGNPNVQTNYQNRVRWTWTFDPTDPTAWRTDIPGKGGALDAATSEPIVGIQFILDRLIVYFESSTWELVWTGNDVYPFIWQKINTELGAESPYSVVPFDKVAIGIANLGVHSCNGIGVQRIDEQIPNLVWDISNANNGPLRVYGIRDFEQEMIYWAYPDDSTSATNYFPNKVLLYNYRNNTWATNDDTITCFGYYQSVAGITWDSNVSWDSNTSWDTDDGNPLLKKIIIGNQEGFTFTLEVDEPTNAPSLQLSGVSATGQLTIINHSLNPDDYIYFTNIAGTGDILALNGTIQQVTVVDQNTITIGVAAFTGTYNGSGTISCVSQFNIQTKQFNFYLDKDMNMSVDKLAFQCNTTSNGEFTLQIYISTNGQDILEQAQQNGSLIGTNMIETSPYIGYYDTEDQSTRLWHPFYLQADGEFIQIGITLSDAEMFDVDVMNSDFQLHSILITASPTSRLQ